MNEWFTKGETITIYTGLTIYAVAFIAAAVVFFIQPCSCGYKEFCPFITHEMKGCNESYSAELGVDMTEKIRQNQTINVINSELNLPHVVSEVICTKCGKRWISARPTEVLLKDLQCPKCKRKGFVIETGQVIEEN